MSKIRSIAIILGVILLAIPSVARAQATGTEIKLITQNTGWALMHGRLYWTTDFGQNWRDITPPVNPPETAIADVFFLDTSNGWVLLRISNTTTENVFFGDWGFELASTDNAGASWSVTPVQLPDLAKWQDLSGDGTLDFVDPAHGWLDLSLTSGAAFNSGAQFATVDGGHTWQRLSVPVGFGWIRFISADVGWAAGGQVMSDFAVTRDGGKTWHPLSLPQPTSLPPNSIPTYRPPYFVNARRAFLPVSFNGWAAAIYATNDAGRTWRIAAVLTGKPGSIGASLPLTIADSILLVPTKGTPSGIRLTRYPLTGAGGLVSGIWPSPSETVGQATFLDSDLGWVLTRGSRLKTMTILGTADGGATWTDVAPKLGHSSAGRAHMAGRQAGPRSWTGQATTTPVGPTLEASATAGGGGAGGGLHTSIHLGFDIAVVMPHAVMPLVASVTK